jgi:hypothetical protein
MSSFRKIALGTAALATLAAAATPAMAVPISPQASVPISPQVSAGGSEDILQQAGDYHRRYRGYRHHRDRVDAGDVIAGIGILAGIAIIADAASKSKRDSRRTSGDRYPESYPQRGDERADRDNRPYSPDGSFGSNYSAGDVGAAVDICSRAAEQSADGDARVDEIRSVTRAGSGWQVQGRMSGNARAFDCTTANGVVDTIRWDDGRDI